MSEKPHDGALPVEDEARGESLGQGGANTHPVSAPNELSFETGTPSFSKGHHPPEQRLVDDDSAVGHPDRASASPSREDA